MAQQTGAIYHQGILYSGGSGTNVTPNPQGEATDTLNTVEIDGTVYGIEGGGGGGSNLIIDAQKYSLEEQVVGIWTDGKPLYQKTFYTAKMDYLSTRTNKNVGSISGIDMVVSLTGILSNSAKTQRYEVPFPFANSGNLTTLHYVYDDNCIYFSSTTTWGDSDLYVTILYTKTTDTAGSGGYQAYGFTPLVYSEEEREVGVWVDNKPLYQKTVVYSSGVNIGTSATTLSTANFPEYATIDKFISGFVNRETTSSKGTASTFLGVWKDGSNLKVYATTTWNGMTHFTFQYTKTTDVAGSGEYNTLAISNVHYSTEEQVIGTWIDGKTLYQTVVEVSGTNIDIRNETYVNVIGVLPTNVSRYIKGELVTYDAGSSLTIGLFGGVLVKGINTSQNKILLYNVSVGQHIEMPQSENYVILQYTKTTD